MTGVLGAFDLCNGAIHVCSKKADTACFLRAGQQCNPHNFHARTRVRHESGQSSMFR